MSEPIEPGRRLPAGVRLLQLRRIVAASPRAVWRFWRRSLQFRTVAIAVVLSAIALTAVGSYMSYAIGRGLFEDRLQQILDQSSRATAAAQKVFTATAATDQTSVDTTRDQAVLVLTQTVSPAGLELVPSASSSATPLTLSTVQVGQSSVVTTELQKAVDSGAATAQHWQSVAIPGTHGGTHPGVVVGSVLQLFGVQASYDLYLVYDLDDVQATLGFVQRTMLIGGLALVVLIGLVTWLVVRLVVAPIRQAAVVSEQLAAGRLEQRIPERGEDVLATLARSFNGMADSLQRQIVQLGNLSRVQQRFVSDVSHELRTPLTTIRLASDVLYSAREDFTAPTARSAELLATQVARFEALLADLLEISRMDAHAADLAGEPTSLVQVAKENIDALGGLAEETGTVVELVAPGGHVEVEVDARRIARIVRNLLANAIEHGEGRPVVVTVDSSETAVALGVRDHGVGLKAADASRVFDRFWRADPSRQRRIGGTGLGLAISLEDAQLHGGTLEVWSEPGAGAHFVLTLPRSASRPIGEPPIGVVPPDAARPATSGTVARSARGRGRRGTKVPR